MTKRELFKEFQKGKTIKYYLEKLKEDSLKRP